MMEIPLTRGMVALVDDEDYDRIMALGPWRAASVDPGGRPYAMGTGPGKKTIYMHRVVAQPPDGVPVDHINRDKLDNRKANLRTCTPSQNVANCATKSNNTSGYIGVRQVRDGKWLARIGANGQEIYLGRFEPSDQHAAVLIRDMAALEIHGEFAYTNLDIIAYG